MKTLVLKCQESVDNPNLRSMNELRLKCISTGDGTGRMNIKPLQSDGTYKGVIEYRVLSGNGYLTTSNGTSKGRTYNVQGFAGVVVPSGETIVQIKNFDLMTDVIGYDGTQFTATPSASAVPQVVLPTSEIKGKTFLKQIYVNDLAGDIGNLAELTSLTYLNFTKGRQGVYGEMSELHNLKSLVKFVCPDQVDMPQINYSLDDITALTSLTTISLQGGVFYGGDIYAMLKNRTYVDFTLSRSTAKTADATCNYVSGTSTVPQFELKKIELGAVGTKYIGLPVAKTLLTMVKDGINASKITLDSSPAIYLGLTSAADSELNTLKSDLTALGVTVTFYT